MVNKIFYITGESEQIFQVGLRPAVLGLAKRFDVKTDPINIEDEKRVRVLASGSSSNIIAFRNYIESHDIRVRKEGPIYSVTDIERYTGPKIDWNFVHLSSISEQMSKGFEAANNALGTTNSELYSIHDKLDKMDDKFGVIGNTLKHIDDKLPDASSPEL
jgi:acylphosphatase